MSKTMTPSAAGSASAAQPETASEASVRWSTISKFELGFVSDAADEFEPVGCGAAGFRRHQPGAGDAAIRHLGLADLQRLDGAIHRRLAKLSARGQALAEPDDA